MHVGMSTVFQNLDREKSDYEVYQSELGLADLAEPGHAGACPPRVPGLDLALCFIRF